ncbi:MAG TPA: SDR family oxidoreductase [Candidatus Eisenbacteria bacterium]|jgi:NAD(P)-dependent dehydrogenase (short-subunit alcohol dehydrogenase family)|nr:SDR family oxidoreductase [Candidatus Eisenbacteria bacterium]
MKRPRPFEDRVVVITGGSAGVGRAAALAFARQGARVALLARGKIGLEAAREELSLRGTRAIAIEVDVADEAVVELAAERIEEELGPIDVWVNNAMAAVFAPFLEIDPTEFRRVTEVCYLGTVHGTLAALKRMKPRGRGVIVQVGSALAYRSIPLQSAYCGAKHAVRGFTDSLRSELLREGSGVKLTMVQLPAINTPQFDWGANRTDRRPRPVPPIFQPEVAARAILWAARHPRRELIVGGSSLLAITAQKFLPGVLDVYLARRGYDAQLTDEPEGPRASNLFRPVEGDRGSHGRFDRQARAHSFQLWINTFRLPAAAGLAGLILLALFLKKI